MFCFHCHQRHLSDENKRKITWLVFIKMYFPFWSKRESPRPLLFWNHSGASERFQTNLSSFQGLTVCRNRESSDWVLPLGWTDLFNPAPTHSFKRTFTEFLQHQWIALSWILHCYSSCTFINVELHWNASWKSTGIVHSHLGTFLWSVMQLTHTCPVQHGYSGCLALLNC